MNEAKKSIPDLKKYPKLNDLVSHVASRIDDEQKRFEKNENTADEIRIN